jgi:hypothetical protein
MAAVKNEYKKVCGSLYSEIRQEYEDIALLYASYLRFLGVRKVEVTQ